MPCDRRSTKFNGETVCLELKNSLIRLCPRESLHANFRNAEELKRKNTHCKERAKGRRILEMDFYKRKEKR